ncbi:3-isopropylmalate dehydratase small subunit [Candidatus Uzinura diaspidicola str. ASNER]|uniref:3-isopropylmalate dehydratase n=1 Tax=Candidatus Uzinura diaspidicola str. ASNER TaxID=1133592 RepID=L7VFY4_9FLAO|nr:3-isopropylmalate dehydratase small subunit [Candidatus Uzinura diaspidicola str. ASNER]
MEKIEILVSRAIPIAIENIDTDQIIPARFLKSSKRQGFGSNLFRDWRYTNQGLVKESFILNNPKFSGKILLVGRNFGSGSSREHAAWSLFDYGFRVVISSFFADIFKENALNNGLLPIEISEVYLQYLFKTISYNRHILYSVFLGRQIIKIDKSFFYDYFSMEKYKKTCLLKGQDDIDHLISLYKKIKTFEVKSVFNDKENSYFIWRWSWR